MGRRDSTDSSADGPAEGFISGTSQPSTGSLPAEPYTGGGGFVAQAAPRGGALAHDPQ